VIFGIIHEHVIFRTKCHFVGSGELCVNYTHNLKALVFLYAFEESVDCHLLSPFCDDSNLHISLFKYVLPTMGVSTIQPLASSS